MAESLVQVTEGVGKKLHTFQRTIGGNAVEDEVVLLGENYLPSYTAVAFTVSTATLNSHALQIMAGASLKVRIRRIDVYQTSLATTAALADLRVIRLSSAGTGGGTITPSPLNPADSASGATVMTLPTVTGTEGVTIALARPYMLQTLGASAQLNQPVVSWDFDRPRSQPLVIATGTTNGICVKNAAAVAGGAVNFLVWFDETSF